MIKPSPEKQLDLREYRTLGLPLLALMGVFALIGIAATFLLGYFF